MKIKCNIEEYALLIRWCQMCEIQDSCSGCLFAMLSDNCCEGIENFVEVEKNGNQTNS